MTKKLEELFNLPEMVDEEQYVEHIDAETALAESAVILDSISNIEKIDMALTSVSGLNNHDDEMDDIAEKAISSYQALMSLGMNVSDAQAGRIFEVSSLMLETALKAKDSKVNRKMKTVEILLKKARLDHDMRIASGASKDEDDDKGHTFDRNELLRIIGENSTKPLAKKK